MPDGGFGEVFEVAPETTGGNASEAQDFPGRSGCEESVGIGNDLFGQGFAEAARRLGTDRDVEVVNKMENVFAVLGFEVAEHDDEAFEVVFAQPAGEFADLRAWPGRRGVIRGIGGCGGSKVRRKGFIEFDIQVAGGVLVPVGQCAGVGDVGKDMGLSDGLRGPRATEAGGSVSGERDEWPRLVAGLGHGREEFGHGGAAGGNDGAGRVGFHAASERKKPGGSFLKVMVERDASMGFGLDEGFDEEGVARSRANHEFTNAMRDAVANDGGGSVP